MRGLRALAVLQNTARRVFSAHRTFRRERADTAVLLLLHVSCAEARIFSLAPERIPVACCS